ncbi:MAG TPA: hypothetical protein EYN66_12245 [Myxococcales bacterium]|nr:hypothetical protein [Myxococcales bacterium]
MGLVLSCGESTEIMGGGTSNSPEEDGYNPWNTDQADTTIGGFGSSETSNSTPEMGIACPDPAELAKVPTCCENNSGHCVPSESMPDGFVDVVATCEGGGKCVPDSIIMSLAEMGEFKPKTCQSVLGAEGRCLSTCVPEVGTNKDLLPQDICEADERCTPCINPLTNEDTGICSGDISCGANSGESDDSNKQSMPVDLCANPPSESPIPLDTLNVCCPDAHCLPQTIVEAMQPGASKLLGSCDGGSGLCVPDQILSTGGLVPPDTCTSVGGAEGRCLSTCVPAVADKADKLPQDVCDAGQLCSPCCDPFTGESTGACDTTCDSGPEQVCNGVPLFQTCCANGQGHCVDKTLIPDDQESKLHKKYCDNKEQLCVPDEMQDLNYKGTPCIGHPLFGDPYQGVCLPQCLKLPEFFMDKKACPEHYICAQCKGPFGGNTGAPGCPGA